MKNKILIVSSNYYENISENLLKGATEELKKNNFEFDVLTAPGCFEIPFLISKNINEYDGFIALGCVIKGETYHFNLISNECAKKIMDISNNYLKPIGFGVLTCENIKQAIERSDITKKNKGKEAANACIKLL
tara:strand:+ start:1968 stop:2366 length:399 start_codon:yes stop_codon:yes gene_type:complete